VTGVNGVLVQTIKEAEVSPATIQHLPMAAQLALNLSYPKTSRKKRTALSQERNVMTSGRTGTDG